MEYNYSSDVPLTNPDYDKFNRYPFAQRISEILASRKDPSSIIIGLYGAWGEGKTSVLNFIENELHNEPELAILNFNPWRYGTEDEMLIYFFYELAKSIEKDIKTRKEIAGEIADKYLKIPASLIGKEDIVGLVASSFTKVDVKELRDRIEKLLEREKKRVVILVDDIDRLDKKEIHSIFRLVKLTADINYTAYVLAFDKEMVSSALQERYGTNKKDTGNSFLEKIIQVPLNLPQLDYLDLRDFCFQEIDEVLKVTESNLNQEEINQYINYFITGIEPNLKTPRQAKLYANILMFSIPLLKEEVNLVDLMLIEGIRVFIPSLYNLIKDDKSIFLSNIDQHHNNLEKEKDKKRERIEEYLDAYPEETKKQIIKLLLYLFPKLNQVYNNTYYGSDWEIKWGETKRLCSPSYFQRYFTYAISNRDVSDVMINNLIELSEGSSEDQVTEYMEQLITKRNAESFLTKMRRSTKKLTPEQAQILAVSICRLSHVLPNPEQFIKVMNPFGQGAMLVSDCIEILGSKEERMELARKTLVESSSISFAIECLFMFPRDKKEHPNPKGFSLEEFNKLAKILAEKISEEIKEDAININDYNSFPNVLYIWSQYGNKHEVVEVMESHLNNDYNFVFDLLESYTSVSYSLGDFASRKSSLHRENYEAIQGIINPEKIIDSLDKTLPNLPLDKEFPNFLENITRKEELARQFKWLHNKVKEENS